MFRRLRGSLALVAVLALAAPVAAYAVPAQLTGTVGPGFTITLKKGTKKVVALKAGNQFRITVTDKSTIHNFRLKGPNRLNKQITRITFTGKKTVTLVLKKGKYTFLCDPHSASMVGTFQVRA